MKKIRWAILGPGNIANKFAQAVKLCEDAELCAVGSTSMERARDFAEKYDIPHVYDSYEELLQNDEIDAVYIATINATHASLIQQCAAAHKAVLCEKPSVLTEQEAIAVQKAAEENQVLVMEGMWTNFLPATAVVKQWMDGGKIGKVRNLSLSFCFHDSGTSRRLFDRELGGGGIYDVGVYCIEYAMHLLGQAPVECKVMAQMTQGGVDEFAVVLLRFPGDVIVDCRAGVTLSSDNEGVIHGDNGRIRVGNFWVDNECTLCDESGKIVEQYIGDKGNGFVYEIRHFNSLLRAGKLQSDVMPLELTRNCAKVYDAVRAGDACR